MSEYSMPTYFQTMPTIGTELTKVNEENIAEIQEVEQEIHALRDAALEAGRSTESLNESGQWTAMQRVMELVDEDTWCPLNSLYNPGDNKDGSDGIVKGLGRIDGKWAVIIASDNKKLAGAWVPGQADDLLRGSDTAKRLHIPLVYVLNCSGVKLDQQELVYPNRRGGGTPFYRNSDLNQIGVPVIVGIYGTNPAGGGYHSISPTILIAHEDANMAVGGAGIVGGMNPKGYVDLEEAEKLIEAQKNLKADIPGTVAIHYGETGFFREVQVDEEGMLDAIRKYMDYLPAYDPEFFRVDDPKEPLFDPNDLYSIVPFNQKRSYDMYEVMARLFDGSEFMEFKHGYGPEMITGLAKIDGMLVGVMTPKGYVAIEEAEKLIEAQKNLKADIPGTVAIHYGETGFFREVQVDEEGMLDAIRKYMDYLPAYDPEFFRVDDPKEPLFDPNDLYSIVPFNQKRSYDMYEVMARLFDGSEFMEFKHGYGPEMITGLAKIDGMLVGVVANMQGMLMNYPEYKMAAYGQAMGVGGKLYRQGLIKMNEFVTLCDRDRIPMLWIQDTTGIDVGNDAERAELLGLGQSLIYSIQSSNLPMMEITLRKGTAAAHYVLGGPQGNDNNAFSLGTATTEIYVMHGETAATAMYARRLVKEQKAGNDLQPTIDKMNKLIQEYSDKSRPKYCAKLGLCDEIVDMNDMRPYIQAFVNSCYQNPVSICPFHQMLLPRIIRDFDNLYSK